MTNFAISPATATTALRDDLAAMLAANELRAYRVRENGTMRHVDLYPLGSTKRDTAEWITNELFEGSTVAKVSRNLHVSTAAVRRILLGLELTEEIEAGDWDGILTDTGLYADSTVVELQDEVAPDAREGTTVTVELADTVQPAFEGNGGTVGEDGEYTITVADKGNRSTARPPVRRVRSHG